MNQILNRPLKVINIGQKSFAQTLEQQKVPVVHVQWRPALAVSAQAQAVIARHRPQIEAANRAVMEIIHSAAPRLIGMTTAIKIPGMHAHKILHAGPPVSWERMCGPMQGAVLGALIYEGLATDEASALARITQGGIEFSPCHELSAVGPMAGVVSASMPLFIVKNETSGNLAYTTMNEGLGKVLRYGAYAPEVIARLKWMEQELYPVLNRALEISGSIDLKAIVAQALHMGDEVHNRNRAATSLFYRQIAPAIVRATGETGDFEKCIRVLNFIHGNDHFFLNLSMALAKATLDPAQAIEKSSIALIMARNGTDFGIKLTGTNYRWFTGPAAVPDALFFPGYTKEDANPDIGDSAITETAGLGGFAIAASPAIVQFVGGKASDALAYTLQMYEIAADESRAYQIPSLNFRGTPVGIDVVKVVEKNILPFIDTGVAHKRAGVGQVGAGVLSAPSEPFIKAYEALAKSLDA